VRYLRVAVSAPGALARTSSIGAFLPACCLFASLFDGAANFDEIPIATRWNLTEMIFTGGAKSQLIKR
jgi:hypothetical protein